MIGRLSLEQMKAWLSVGVVVAGLLCGWLALSWTRSWDESTRATGWPFVIAVFHWEEDHWVDYVGNVSGMLGDFLVGFAIPVAPYVAYCWFTRGRTDRPERPPQAP